MADLEKLLEKNAGVGLILIWGNWALKVMWSSGNDCKGKVVGITPPCGNYLEKSSKTQFHVVISCLAYSSSTVAWSCWKKKLVFRNVFSTPLKRVADLDCTKWDSLKETRNWIWVNTESEPFVNLQFMTFFSWFPTLLTGILICFTSVVLLFWLWNKVVTCFIPTSV